MFSSCVQLTHCELEGEKKCYFVFDMSSQYVKITVLITGDTMNHEKLAEVDMREKHHLPEKERSSGKSSRGFFTGFIGRSMSVVIVAIIINLFVLIFILYKHLIG